MQSLARGYAIDQSFSTGNYGLIVAVLAVYAMYAYLPNLRCHSYSAPSISKPFLLMSFVFLVGGFTAINRFGSVTLSLCHQHLIVL